ncbi:hypothetical protein [Halobiforma nitratireducens]|uniref:hypothetical protein n=1 Tax=Halobiforma nitratireducens TaxID=130048 RepID=UPI0012687345|nr:hypothetical protein [Halobiforma nitratireducens]
MPVACSLYDLTNGFNTQQVYQDLQGFETTVDDENANDLIHSDLVGNVDSDEFELKITTTALNRQGGMLRCTIEYDTLKPRGHRAHERPWYKDVERFVVQFSDGLFEDGGFVILGSKSKRASAMLHLQEVLDLSPNDYERRDIPTGVIEDIVETDSKDSKTRTVEDYDEYTETASASGRLNEMGSLGNDLEDRGNTTWEMFESMDYDGVLGISTETVVFYGNIWEEETRIEYLENKITPKILETID